MAGLVLLVAVAAGLLGQGGYYAPVQRYVAALVAAATVLALAAWPLARSDGRLPLLVPALALAAWAVVDGALLGVAGAGVRPALLLLGVVAVLLVCRRLGQEDREVLLLGVTGIGLAVAVAGWLGVAGHSGSWAFQAQGLWRASSTLSYPNATAAVLAPVGLLVLARRVGMPRSVPLALAATGLLAGLGATMSRAGAFALAVGLLVLAGLQGPRTIARAAAGPVAGAVVALACLLPSMLDTSPPRPALALAGLCAGLTLAAVVARLPWPMVAVPLGGALAIGVAALLAIGGLGGAAQTVAGARINLASPDRTGALRAALRVVAEHPLTGAGPGRADLRWEGQDHVTHVFAYAHNEYAQVAADLGLVGLMLLAVLLVALAGLLWSARSTGPGGTTWAGVVAATAAFAVHSGFDFVWHLPAVVLTVTLLAGVVLPAPDTADVPKPSLTVRKKGDR
ncbi:MAG TPA: O-antigen ligase family protein [Actinomycetes bacterium]